MKKHLLMCAAAIAASAPFTPPAMSQTSTAADNPLMKPFDTPFGIPPYEKIKPEHYVPAIKAAIENQRAEIKAICDNPEAPTFENTIIALDYSGEDLNRAAGVFFGLSEALNTPEMEKVADVVMPLYSKFNDEIMLNDKLFARIKTVYDNLSSLNLPTPERRLVEKYYKDFSLNGALLQGADKEALKKVNNDLTEIYIKFNRNLLNATNAFGIVVEDASRLSGLPEGSIAVAAEEAAKRGMEGKWVFTLHAPSRLPVLQYADDRDLRREMWEGYTSLASSGEYNNYPVIKEILKKRAEKARLLGFKDFASYRTAPYMAKTPEAAENLLMQIWTPAVAKVKEEVADMQAIVKEEGHDFKIAPWDYYYYADKDRRRKFNLDENEVRQYFAVDSVRKGIFNLAEKLYGITFTELPDAPKYHPEVTVYEVKDAAGEHVAIFMTDYFPRASKRQGAWMDAVVGGCIKPDGTSIRPIVYNVGNFSLPTATTPSLLTLDEIETTFHEFGHGLHGMLSRAKYPSQMGTNVDRDFVELPSQINEHWALEPELVKTYAKHWKTGETIPDSLIAKLHAAATHNQGFMTAELSGAALLDLAWGHLNPEAEDIDVAGFENEVARKLGMPEELTFRYRSPYFKHVFGDDHYASGYYTYLWAAVLDTDGFELFREKGVFDPATAASYLHNILEAGGTEDPMVLFERFRGHRPDASALLRSRGLSK